MLNIYTIVTGKYYLWLSHIMLFDYISFRIPTFVSLEANNYFSSFD